jgi:hypothetical protein
MEAAGMKNERMFKQYMTALSEIHGKELSALLNSLYWKTLESFADAECERAFKELILSSKFFPKQADFLEILKGKEEDQAARAWIKVVESVRRIGPWESVKFDDPVIHTVLKFMGGWSVTGDWKENELKWKQKEFERLYAVMAKGGKHPEYLPGQCEVDNAAAGYDREPEIIMIGFDEKAKEIAA